MQVWSARGPLVLVSSPELAREVLVHNHARPKAPTLFNTKPDLEFDSASVIAATCGPDLPLLLLLLCMGPEDASLLTLTGWCTLQRRSGCFQ